MEIKPFKEAYEKSQFYNGLIYGYPSCCVEAFVWNHDSIPMKGSFIGTGFCPCKACSTSKTHEQLLDEINANSLLPVQFVMENQETLEKGFYRDRDALADEIYEVLRKTLIPLERIRELLVNQKLWSPLTRSLDCYRLTDKTGESWYYFTDRFADRYVPVLSARGERGYLYIPKKEMRAGNKVTSAATIKELRETHPWLYNNKDFKLNLAVISAAEKQSLVSKIFSKAYFEKFA